MSRRDSRPPLAPLDPLQRYSIDESCSYLRLSRPRLYDKINAGEIRSIRDGKRRFIPGSEIARASALPPSETRAA